MLLYRLMTSTYLDFNLSLQWTLLLSQAAV